MSDLLDRAKNEPEAKPRRVETPRKPAHAMESMNAIAVDIARAINDPSFTDLYKRYQAGEQDIFVRRLYAQRDRGIVEEIRRRYGQDAETRTAVDNYLDGFENLLSEIARNDRDGTLRQMYLTSEPSKVYSLLADAAGRPL